MARRPRSDLPDGPIATSLGMVELRTDNDGVMLLIDGIESSHLDLDDPTHLVFEYMQQMVTVLEQTHHAPSLRVVHLGGAGCALARAVDAQWPQSRQLAIELDEKLAVGVREWFELPRSPRLRIRVGEARQELATLPPLSCDVIVRDAFQGRMVPTHLATTEFTSMVQEALKPDGVYLANLADGPPLRYARAEVATITSTFRHVVAIGEPAVLKGRRYGNVVIAAANQPIDTVSLARALRRLPVPAGLIADRQLHDFIAGTSPNSDATEHPPFPPLP